MQELEREELKSTWDWRRWSARRSNAHRSFRGKKWKCKWSGREKMILCFSVARAVDVACPVRERKKKIKIKIADVFHEESLNGIFVLFKLKVVKIGGI
jgi:hypothetical protein